MNIQREKKVHSVSLASLVKYYFKEDISDTKGEDTWRMNYHLLEGKAISQWPNAAIDYAIQDSVWAYKIFKHQDKVNYKLAVESEVILNLIGAFGMLVDADRVDLLEKEIEQLLNPHYKLLINKGICTPVKNRHRPKNNIKILKEYIESVVEPLYTPKKNVRSDAEALHYYLTQCPDDEIFNSYLKVMKYDKILTAYVSRLKGNNLIRSRYSSTKETGRTSSFGDKNYPSVNIQQPPRKVEGVTWDVRNCFVPRKGYVYCSIDYSNLELASTSHQLYSVFGKSKTRDIFNSGDAPVDMHSQLAVNLMYLQNKTSVSYEEFVANKKREDFSFYRQLAKPINLGFRGGIGYDTMRGLLFKQGIIPKFKVLYTSDNEKALYSAMWKVKSEMPDLRVARIGARKYAIVQDELIAFKRQLFNLDPELELFLKERHTRYLDGDKFKMIKDEWGTWQKEPMYKYTTAGFTRKYCTYTALCNGFLMQTPSAIGAKTAVCNVAEKYMEREDVNLLAFIHDEIVFEILDNDNKCAIMKDIANIMIDSMQSVLTSVRVAVEAEVMDYWRKSGGSLSKTYWKNPCESKLYTT